MPRVIQVIQSDESRGEGTDEDICRTVIQYHDFEGNFLAEFDTYYGAQSYTGKKEDM